MQFRVMELDSDNRPIEPERARIPRWLFWLALGVLASLALTAFGCTVGLLGLFVLLPLIFVRKKSGT